jgi:hypothetical protein
LQVGGPSLAFYCSCQKMEKCVAFLYHLGAFGANMDRYAAV